LQRKHEERNHDQSETRRKSPSIAPQRSQKRRRHRCRRGVARGRRGSGRFESSKIVKGATLKVYKGLPHGMCQTNKDQINADLLAFVKA